MKLARAIATPALPLSGGGGRWTAASALDDEWRGFSLDFLSNTYAVRTATDAELLLGAGPIRADNGLGLDFTVNSYAIGI